MNKRMKENNQEIEERENPIRRATGALVTVVLILAVALCLYMVIQVLSHGYVNIGGFMMFRVITGSMEPTIPTGALLVTQQTDIDTIAVGDIICFRTQEAEIWGKVVTHRVTAIQTAIDGSPLLQTKGDANLAADGFYVSGDNFIGKVIWYTGENHMLSDIFSFFTNKIGFLACIVLPCLLLAGLILRESVRSIRCELEAVLEEEQQEDPLLSMSKEEYDAMYERIRNELIEELMNSAQSQQTE